MKKAILFLLSIVMAMFCYACDGGGGGDVPGDETVKEKSYEELYDGSPKKIYDVVAPNGRHRASYGYSYNKVQGYNQWNYASGKQGVFSDMSYNDSDTAWQSIGGSSLKSGALSAGEGEEVAFIFTSPIMATAIISDTQRMTIAGDTDAKTKVLKNGIQVYPASGSVTIEKTDLIGNYYSFSLSVAVGDKISFVVIEGKNVYSNPTVDFTGKASDTLYYVPEWGYYGDLHQYYYNDTVNLYHLRNMGGNNWIWYLDQSRDMFRYREAINYTTEFVKDHYMAYGTMGDLIDYSIYPDGGRDCTQFFDGQTNNYRYFGLTYKKKTGDVNCDLSMRKSSDADGWEWDTPAVPLRTFPARADGEPECAFFRQIGNQWYLGAGISGQSKHGVGGLSYWTGAKNATIDETDWQNAETHRLDGEDLAVPQIEEVGGRYYLYGWMPQNYNGGQWGGYKNLPREVFQREDGLLGTKLDPMATKLVNRGVLLKANQTNMVSKQGNVQLVGSKAIMSGESRIEIDGKYDSTFVTYDLTLDGSGAAGFTMTDGDKEYRLLIEKSSAGTNLKIDCPNDAQNPISSSLYFGDNSLKDFKIKAVIEGSIIEFYVNDTLALSGRTSMGSVYKAGLYARGSATFDNVVINRLAQLYDVYD